MIERIRGMTDDMDAARTTAGAEEEVMIISEPVPHLQIVVLPVDRVLW